MTESAREEALRLASEAGLFPVHPPSQEVLGQLARLIALARAPQLLDPPTGVTGRSGAEYKNEANTPARVHIAGEFPWSRADAEAAIALACAAVKRQCDEDCAKLLVEAGEKLRDRVATAEQLLREASVKLRAAANEGRKDFAANLLKRIDVWIEHEKSTSI